MQPVDRNHCFGDFFRRLKLAPDAPAIYAPGRTTLSYAQLCGQIEYTASFLDSRDFNRMSRIGVALPGGPDMAVLFPAVVSRCAFVPLSPRYTEPEYAARLSVLGIHAVIVDSASDSPVRDVARRQGMAVIELSPQEGAGLFTLDQETGFSALPAAPRDPQPEDIALALETSGTLSKPKVVPLTQENIFASAYFIAHSLLLGSGDRCLNIMPMHHIAGLVTPVLAVLSSGGSVICTPGFAAEEFFRWLRTYEPTWYSAVPAMHQAIVEEAEASSLGARQSSLRFVRSTTSPLFEPLFRKLEDLFDRPVVQAYGLSEALPVTATPLSPYVRRPASVGVPVSDVAVLDDRDGVVGNAALRTGEIVVRGPQVFAGYENDTSGSASAFVDGWFRTGDVGYLDNEGHLYLTGRLKEIINRGGQKVSPQEVEAVLLGHPAVRDAAVFGMPHPRLGEAVAAAVVLSGEEPLTIAALRDYAAARLSSHKVPQHIIAASHIPKGPTGKLQRSGLAREFATQPKPTFVATSTDDEKLLTRLWEEILRSSPIGITDNFFDLGGDSLMVHQLFSGIEKEFGVTLPHSAILQAPTVSELIAEIDANRQPKSFISLMPLRPGGSRPPLICLSHVGGDLLLYDRMARHLDPEQPVYGLEITKGALSASMEEAASQCIAAIRRIWPAGPFNLLGFSSGGLMAHEMARRLRETGIDVFFVGILDSTVLGHCEGKIAGRRLKMLAHSLKNLPYWAYHYLPLWLDYFLGRMKEMLHRPPGAAQTTGTHSPADEIALLLKKVIDWQNCFSPKRYPGRIIFFRASAQALWSSLPDMGWGCFADKVTVHVIPGTHTSIVKDPRLRIFAEKVERELRAYSGSQQSRK